MAIVVCTTVDYRTKEGEHMGAIDWACSKCGDSGRSVVVLAMCPTCQAPLAKPFTATKHDDMESPPRFERGELAPRDRVRFGENRKKTLGTVIAVLPDGRLVVAWDDHYVDVDGNFYNANDLTWIE